jgi:hypothetical protein
MVLDKVLTVAIGRNTSAGQAMPRSKWQQFQARAKAALAQEGLVVAHAIGDATGSDGVNEGADEDTAVIVCINPRNVERARQSLATLLPQYGQSSAAFAYDSGHEPVFPTQNGYRAAI